MLGAKFVLGDFGIFCITKGVDPRQQRRSHMNMYTRSAFGGLWNMTALRLCFSAIRG